MNLISHVHSLNIPSFRFVSSRLVSSLLLDSPLRLFMSLPSLFSPHPFPLSLYLNSHSHSSPPPSFPLSFLPYPFSLTLLSVFAPHPPSYPSSHTLSPLLHLPLFLPASLPTSPYLPSSFLTAASKNTPTLSTSSNDDLQFVTQNKSTGSHGYLKVTHTIKKNVNKLFIFSY